MKEMRVLISIDSLGRGGKERRLIELLKRFENNSSIKVIVVIFKNVVEYKEIHDFKNIDLIIFDRKIKKDPTVFLKVYHLCKRFKPDIIHSWGSMSSVYTFIIAKLMHIKFINAMVADSVCPRFSHSWWHKNLTFPFSDVIVSNSEAGLIAYNVPKSKALVIKNGFNFERTLNLKTAREIKEKFSVVTPYVVGMVGGFNQRKDFLTFIMASKKMLKKRNDITFVMVGEGPTMEGCKKIVDSKYKQHIRFLGHQDDVESIINIFNIGVLVTNYKIHKEGISNSILEYMALGKPVIATKGGGTDEIVIHEKTGYVIKPGNLQQLTEKIEYLIRNPKVAKQMGDDGRKWVKEEFGIEKMVKLTTDLYKKVLS